MVPAINGGQNYPRKLKEMDNKLKKGLISENQYIARKLSRIKAVAVFDILPY